MSEQASLIERTVKQVTAILGEADVYARTGRTRPDIGAVPEGATIASLIEHTLLDAEATAREIEMLCYQAKEYGFATVCVNSVYVPLARELLKDSDVRVCTVVGFPFGATLPQIKRYAAQEAIKNGAQEVDMVLHIGALKARDIVALHEDISDIAEVCHAQDPEVTCKVIIETALLTDTEKIIACQIARMAGIDFVKTSTGYNTGGATANDISLMREVVGAGVGVKASGGIDSLDDAKDLINSGANRIGTSHGVAIAMEERTIESAEKKEQDN